MSPPPKGTEDAEKRERELPREGVKPGRAERARGQWAKSQQSRDEEGANRRVGYRDQGLTLCSQHVGPLDSKGGANTRAETSQEAAQE